MPRFRSDLAARRGELQGVTFYDVSDPRNGTTFRMYEVEYLVAMRLDGRELDAVAADVAEGLGVATDIEELRHYAKALGALGFLEETTDSAQAATPEAARGDGTEGEFADSALTPVADPAEVHALLARAESPIAEPPPEPHIETAQTLFAAPASAATSTLRDGVRVARRGQEEDSAEDAAAFAQAAVATAQAGAARRREGSLAATIPRPPTQLPPTLPPEPTELPGGAPPPLPPAPLPHGAERESPLSEVAAESTDRVRPSALARARALPLAWLFVPGGLVIALVAAAVSLPSRRPVPTQRVVAVPVRTEAVVRLYPEAAQLHAVEPLTFSFGGDGTVVELVPPNQQVKVGDALAKLDGFSKLEKQLEELRSRETYYQGELEKAERNGNDKALEHAKAKVEEKRSLVAGVQSRYAKMVIASTAPGLVSANHVKVGDEVSAGQPVTSVVQLRLRADFTMPASDAMALKASMLGQLLRESNQLVECRIEKIDESGAEATVRVAVLDINSGVLAGQTVRLVRHNWNDVIKLPASALLRGGGQDRVFVVQDGKARARVVLVAEREGPEVLVKQGISPGERVIVSGADGLADGAAVQAP